MAEPLTSQGTASQHPLEDAMETLLKQLFFVHTHWERIRHDLGDGPTFQQLAVTAYHLRGILQCWLLDGGYGESQDTVRTVEMTCKHLETLHGHFWNRSVKEGRR